MQERSSPMSPAPPGPTNRRDARRQEIVKREGRIDGCVGRDRAGSSENARNVLAWNWDDTGRDFVPPRPLAGGDQERRENRGKEYTHAGTEQSISTV